VREIPIVFCDRRAGTSKMSARIAAEAMWLVPLLRRSAATALANAGRPTRALQRTVGEQD
jgi:hypothetical protein